MLLTPWYYISEISDFLIHYFWPFILLNTTAKGTGIITDLWHFLSSSLKCNMHMSNWEKVLTLHLKPKLSCIVFKSSKCSKHYCEFHVKLKTKRLDFYTPTLATQCFGCLSAMTKKEIINRKRKDFALKCRISKHSPGCDVAWHGSNTGATIIRLLLAKPFNSIIMTVFPGNMWLLQTSSRAPFEGRGMYK